MATQGPLSLPPTPPKRAPRKPLPPGPFGPPLIPLPAPPAPHDANVNGNGNSNTNTNTNTNAHRTPSTNSHGPVPEPAVPAVSAPPLAGMSMSSMSMSLPLPPMPLAPAAFLPQPANKRECLTRYVFPAVPGGPRSTNGAQAHPPLAGPDIDRALDQLAARSQRDAKRNGGAPTHIRVQYHAGLQALLFNAVRRVARRPAFVPPLTHAEERALEAYDAGVDEWHSRCVRAHAAVIGSAQSEATACQEGFAHLAEPINDFVADSANFERGKHPMFTTGWVWPTPKDASGLTDWVAYSSDTPQAILKWKQGVTDANMRDVVQAAVGRVHSWPLALYPGFSIWLDDDGNRVVTDSGVAGNGVAACLLGWSDSHHYGTRWTVIFNGRTALILFLAKPDQLFISELIPHDAGMVGDDLTIAVAMFALCVLEPIDRPTVTMSEQVLRFYISPPKRHRSLPPVASSDSEGDNNDEGIDWVLRISKRKR